MKKTTVVLISSILMVLSVSVLSFGGETENITAFGITLGKSLTEAGIRECKYNTNKNIPNSKFYDYRDTDCYRERDFSTSCYTTLQSELSFPATIDLVFLNRCDRQSSVQEIQVVFNSENYSNMMTLAQDKFGTPTKTEKSSVQNKMGAEFTKLDTFWNVKNCSIYLSNIASGLDDKGILVIKTADKLR